VCKRERKRKTERREEKDREQGTGQQI